MFPSEPAPPGRSQIVILTSRDREGAVKELWKYRIAWTLRGPLADARGSLELLAIALPGPPDPRTPATPEWAWGHTCTSDSSNGGSDWPLRIPATPRPERLPGSGVRGRGVLAQTARSPGAAARHLTDGD
jgi:hypothetical protein